MTPDGRRAVSGSDDRTLKVWDLAAGALLRDPQGPYRCGQCGGGDAGRPARRLGLWGQHAQGLGPGQRAPRSRTLKGHADWVTARGGDAGRPARRLRLSDDRTLKVWDLASGAALRTLEGHTDGVKAVAVTPDGRRAVSGL